MMYLCLALICAAAFAFAAVRRKFRVATDIANSEAVLSCPQGARASLTPPCKGTLTRSGKILSVFPKDSAPPTALSRPKAVVCITAQATPALPPQTPLLALYSELARAFRDAKRRGGGGAVNSSQRAAVFSALDTRVRSLVGGYLSAGHGDWRRYTAWNDQHYVRNLVDGCDDFELLLICWRPGQGSRIHNHADSHCWLTVMDGCVEELQCRAAGLAAEATASPAAQQPLCELPGVLGASAPCPALTDMRKRTVPQGCTAYINDSIALHAISCPTTCPGEGAVTLHLYAPPIRRVKLYETDNNRVVERVPGYYTVRGHKASA